MKVKGIPFNDRATPENLLEFKTDEDVEKFLKDKFSGGYVFGTDTLVKNGHFRFMAYSYDFRPYLKKFLVQLHYGGYQDGYAPNKGALRRAMHLTRNDKVYNFPTK